MDDIELRKWCLEKAMAFCEEVGVEPSYDSDTNLTQDTLYCADMFYRWLTDDQELRKKFARMELDHSKLNTRYETGAVDEEEKDYKDTFNTQGLIDRYNARMDEAMTNRREVFFSKPDLGFDPILLARIDEVPIIYDNTFFKDYFAFGEDALRYNYIGDLVCRFPDRFMQFLDMSSCHKEWYNRFLPFQTWLKEKNLELNFVDDSIIHPSEIHRIKHVESQKSNTNFWPPENIEELRALYKDEIAERLKNE